MSRRVEKIQGGPGDLRVPCGVSPRSLQGRMFGVGSAGRTAALGLLLGFLGGGRGGLGFCFLLIVLLAAGLSVRGRRGGGCLLGVVGDVPPRTLELHRRRRQDLLDRAAAVGTFFHMRIGKLLDPFKTMVAFFALILVNGHETPLFRYARAARGNCMAGTA